MKPNLYVVDAIAESAKFAFREFGNAIRLGWFPLGLGLIGAYLVALDGGQVGQNVGTNVEGAGFYINNEMSFFLPSDLTLQGWVGLALSVVSLILTFPLLVLWYRRASEQIEAPGGLFFFQWSGREWRFILASIALPIFYVLLAVAVVVLVFAIGPLVSGSSIGDLNFSIGGRVEANTLQNILIFTGFVFILWLMVRLCLVVPVAAIENRLSIGRAFGLTSGRYWKIIALFITVIICIFILAVPYSLMSAGLTALVSELSQSHGEAYAFVFDAIPRLFGGIVTLLTNLFGIALASRVWLDLSLGGMDMQKGEESAP